MWVPGRLWGLGREEGVGTEGKTATDSSMCLSFCLSPWWHTRMPDPQGVICSGALQHLLIPPWSASFSQTEISFERKQEEGKEEAAALTVDRKLTFPSSSSAFRSKDRCSWTVAEPEEPCHGGDTETGERKCHKKGKKKEEAQFPFVAISFVAMFPIRSSGQQKRSVYPQSVLYVWTVLFDSAQKRLSFNNSRQPNRLCLIKEQSVFKCNLKEHL